MRGAALAAAIAMFIAALIFPTVTADAADAEQVLAWQLTNGGVPPAQRVVRVLKGERLRWLIRSDRAGELHLHAYRLSVKVQPGQTAELAFTAHATGRFRVEWHAAGGEAARAEHHAAPLAMLEVRPN